MSNQILFNQQILAKETSFSKSVLSQKKIKEKLPEILFLTSYPPRQCGIATYTQDLLKALNSKFGNSFSLQVCALESGKHNLSYPEEVKFVLDTHDPKQFEELANAINNDDNLHQVFIQHEFGLFQDRGNDFFMQFLYTLSKPVVLIFHTVLPQPTEILKEKVRRMGEGCVSIVVMTQNAAQILEEDYGLNKQKIEVIEHGTHLIPHFDSEVLKEKMGLKGRIVLSTFGLLSSGKGIETTLNALPSIIQLNPEVVFLILGKTHPGIIQSEGEKYREMLKAKVKTLSLQDHVIFINEYLPLQKLLEYLQLTDIYLFTSRDPHQAVSGTFAYAMSCGCPIISTPIPHAKEVLKENTGIIIDFQDSNQLAEGVNHLLNDEYLIKNFNSNVLHRIAPTAWENAAIAHALLIEKVSSNSPKLIGLKESRKIELTYTLPPLNLKHLKKMTTDFGIIQFAKINQPDIESGYTLDDNARALIVMCMHYELTGNPEDLKYIKIYLEFIQFCQQPEGDFLNYLDEQRQFTTQNQATNLADANGRAIWALGFLISKCSDMIGISVVAVEKNLMLALPYIEEIHSTRAMAFTIKGLYYANTVLKSEKISDIIKLLANRMLQMFRHESEENWFWFESYLTYANSVLPEALLCAWQDSKEVIYKETAKKAFDFLLSLTFQEDKIRVISNRTWLHRGEETGTHGEQPIDVAYTILATCRFWEVFGDDSYSHKIKMAFNWFLGDNQIHQIIYNPCTGGCYDGLEEHHVNLNQGAESTLSYLMARLSIDS